MPSVESIRASRAPSRKNATAILAIGGYINSAISIVQGLLLVPLYLLHLGANTYGLWLASGGLLGMLMLVNIGIGSLMTQRIANAYGMKRYSIIGGYFVNGLFVYLCICIVYAAIGWIFSYWLTSILSVDEKERETLVQCYRLALIAMTAGLINECLRSFGQAMLRPIVPMIAIVTGRILGIVITVWMLLAGFGLWSIPIGMIFTEFFVLASNSVHAFYILKNIEGRKRLDKNLLIDYIKTSPALLLSKSGSALSQNSEPFLIATLINAEATTLYMIIRKAADIVYMIVNVLSGSILGSFSHLAGEGNEKKVRDLAPRLVWIIFILSLVGFSTYIAANASFIALWIDDAPTVDQTLVLILGVGFLLLAARGMLWQLLYALNDIQFTSVIVILESIAKIILAIVLIKSFGVIGVAYAIAISCMASFLVLCIRLFTNLAIPMQSQDLFRILLAILAAIATIQLTPTSFSWIAFGLESALIGTSLSIVLAIIYWKPMFAFYRDSRSHTNAD